MCLKLQKCFSGLFSSLLRLLATHFPHLSLVEDWLDDEIITIEDGKDPAPNNSVLAKSIEEGKGRADLNNFKTYFEIPQI